MCSSTESVKLKLLPAPMSKKEILTFQIANFFLTQIHSANVYPNAEVHRISQPELLGSDE